MLPEWKHVPASELDQRVFDALVPSDHYLRQVKKAIDFERFRAVLAECYSAYRGRPACDPVLMLKLLFLRHQYNLSDRGVIKETQVNVAYRYFADLSLDSDLPHHTTFDYFRDRLGPEKFQALFAEVVAQAREHGLVKDRLRLKDATHVIANIAIPSTLRLVADTRVRLLDAAEPLAPEWTAAQRQRAEAIRTSTVDLANEERLLQRVTHLRHIVAEAEGVLEKGAAGEPADRPDPRHTRLKEAVRLARKVLDDRDDPDAGDKLVSVHDPDARTGWHHQFFVGYLLDLSMDADSEVLTAINVLPGNGDEGADAATLIEQEETAHGNDVEQLSIDGAGFRGPLLRDWTERLSLDVIVPPAPPPDRKGLPPEAFRQDADGALHCPAGQTTRTRERNRHDTGWKYRFAASTCAGCPRRAECLSNPKQSGGRAVIMNDYEAEYQAARTKAQTPAYAQARREHPKVERKLNELVRWHQARRAEGRGQPRMLMQALATGLVVNVKRIVKLLFAPPEEATGRARAELAVQT